VVLETARDGMQIIYILPEVFSRFQCDKDLSHGAE
jgi:hypothetical protein